MTDTTTSQDQEKQLEAKMPERPATVKNAVWILYVSLLLGAAASAYVTLALGQAPSGGEIFSLLLTWFLIVKISKGRNWARWIFLILFVLGALMILPTITVIYSLMPGIAAFFGLQTVLQLLGAVLLFVPSSNAWFRAVKESKRAIKEQQRIQKAAQ